MNNQPQGSFGLKSDSNNVSSLTPLRVKILVGNVDAGHEDNYKEKKDLFFKSNTF